MKIVVLVNTNRKINKIIQFVPFFKSYLYRTSRLESSEPKPQRFMAPAPPNDAAPAPSKLCGFGSTNMMRFRLRTTG
jgi:hypothetical protein